MQKWYNLMPCSKIGHDSKCKHESNLQACVQALLYPTMLQQVAVQVLE